MVTIERIKHCDSQIKFFNELDDFLLGCPTGKYGLPVMEEVPEGLIDIVSAAAKYGEKLENIGAWITKGRVRQVAWRHNPKRNIRVVVESELQYYMDGPRLTNKGGKHRRAFRFVR